MPKVNRRVRFYEIRGEDGTRLAEVKDLERHFYAPVATLDQDALEHWQGESGTRARGRVYRASTGPKPRVDLVIIDKVHREPPFSYVRQGQYSEHEFPDPDTQFAEPKFLAFFEKNIVATFTTGLRMNVVEACLNTWRIAQGLAPISLHPVMDVERLSKLANARGVDRIEITLPADVARDVYRNRGSSLATFMRSRAVREGMISVTLAVDTEDPQATEELRFLVQDDERYDAIASAARSEVRATYYSEDAGRGRSHSFLGQELAISVTVDIDEPERGPQPHVASEALVRAHERKRDPLHLVLGQG